ECVDRNDPRARRFVARLYAAGIRRMDAETIRPLLARLDQLALARDTLVVFTSDHGEAFGEHGHFQHDDLYAGTLHVPLVLRWPGRLPAGLTIGSRGRLIDVMPTILELLGVSAPPSLQGRSLTPLLHDAYAGPGVEGAVSEYSDARVYESLRRGGLSYIVDGPEERLFDLLRDPGAVVAQRPEAPVRIRGIRPGRNTNPNAGYRTALIAPAPSLLRYRVAVPEQASLRFGAGVEPPDRIDPAAPGVRFTVRVDERRVFSRVLNPQAHRHDRKWTDE